MSHHEFIEKIQNPGFIILNQGFSLQDFENFSSEKGGRFIEKEEKHTVIGGNSGRDQVGDRKSVFTATGLKSGHEVPLHGELYFQYKNPPDLLWFFCDVPGDTSDSTWYCDGLALFEALSKSTQQYLIEHNKATYHRYHPDQIWQSLYGVEDPEILRRLLVDKKVLMRYIPEERAVWTAFESPILQPCGNSWAFVNNILPFGIREIFYPEETKSYVKFGRGVKHKRELVLEIFEASKPLTREIVWEKGMVAILNNKRILHGRGKIKNFDRKVFVRMSYLN
jgi:alpha-ketoglutarate-dependent taurine dioxygenase